MSTWDEQLAAWTAELTGGEDEDRWVTLAEAEEEVGVSRSTLRSWYRSDQIQSRLLDGPHGPQRLVRLEEVAARAARSAKLGRRAERELALEAQLVVLRHRLDVLAGRVGALERALRAGGAGHPPGPGAAGRP